MSPAQRRGICSRELSTSEQSLSRLWSELRSEEPTGNGETQPRFSVGESSFHLKPLRSISSLKSKSKSGPFDFMSLHEFEIEIGVSGGGLEIPGSRSVTIGFHDLLPFFLLIN